MKEIHGEEKIKRKIAYIGGDVSLPDLGLTESDRKLLIDEVNIVFHLAATIRFDEPLKKAVLLNTRGTKLVLELAKQMKNLEVFNKGFCMNNQPLGTTNKQYPSEKKFLPLFL